ncbi:MAG: tetratricopeptide repeat protein, partial [Phycisphaerales bacterium]|nr:tetratricopeptide repeat protein [Phycisphaerales bacterium]
MLATLLIGLMLSTALYVEAEGARRRAEIEVVRAEQITRILESMISGIDPAFAQGEGTTLLELILDDTSRRLERDAVPDDVRASLDAVLGRAWERIARYERAAPHLDRAIAWMEAHLDDVDPERLRAEAWRAELAIAVGEIDDAEARIERVRRLQASSLGPGHADTLASVLVLSRVRYERADLEGMRALLEPALDAARTTQGADSVEVAELETALAGCHFTMQRFDEGIPLATHALDVLERVHGPMHPSTIGARKTWGNGLLQRREYAAAVTSYETLIADASHVFGPSHPVVLAMTSNMAFGLQQMGRLDEASATLERLAGLQRVALGPHHPDTVV